MTTRTTQPTSSTVSYDSGSALNTGIQLLYNPAAYGGDLVNTVPFTSDTGTNVTISSNNATVGRKFAAGQLAYWPMSVCSGITTGNYTVTILVRPDVQADNAHAISTLSLDQHTSGFAINLRDTAFNSTGISALLNNLTVETTETNVSGTSLSHAGTGTTVTTNTFYVLTWAYASSGTATLYVNGTAFGPFNGTHNSFQGDSVVLGNITRTGALDGQCTVAFAHIVAQTLNSTQAASLASNLWQVFTPIAAATGVGAPAPLPSIGLVLGPTTANTLSASSGSYALTGVAAILKPRYKLTTAAGAFTLTGQDASLATGTLAQGGDAAPLPSLSTLFIADSGVKFVTAATGSFAVTGKTASLNRGRGLTAAAASFVATFAPSQSDSQMTSGAGSFSLTGVAASRKFAVQAAKGTFVLTGQPSAGILEAAGGKTLAALPAAFILTGIDASSSAPRRISANPGAFALTGQSVIFDSLHWVREDPVSSVWTNVTPTSTAWTNA